ncbi:hypothetical protein RB195_021010 [Necator americanus]|uniref:Uncharacterized protein n=1 Tax=Necator americanus TaxID=51031 RepID=A0ABR1CMR8_NECAM
MTYYRRAALLADVVALLFVEITGSWLQRATPIHAPHPAIGSLNDMRPFEEDGYWLHVPKPWRKGQIMDLVRRGDVAKKCKSLESAIHTLKFVKRSRNSNIRFDYTHGRSLFLLPKALSQGVHLWKKYEGSFRRWLQSTNLQNSNATPTPEDVFIENVSSSQTPSSHNLFELNDSSFYEENPFRAFYTVWHCNTSKIPESKLATTEKICDYFDSVSRSNAVQRHLLKPPRGGVSGKMNHSSSLSSKGRDTLQRWSRLVSRYDAGHESAEDEDPVDIWNRAVNSFVCLKSIKSSSSQTFRRDSCYEVTCSEKSTKTRRGTSSVCSTPKKSAARAAVNSADSLTGVVVCAVSGYAHIPVYLTPKHGLIKVARFCAAAARRKVINIKSEESARIDERREVLAWASMTKTTFSRLRRDKPSVIYSIDFCIPTSDETLDKPDSIDAGCESLQNREEVEARLSNLRRIGLRAHPLQALRRYLLNKVATGEEPNPWVSTVHEEKVFRRKLRRYITGMIIRACSEEGVENCQIEPSHADAFSFIDNINKELVESLAAVGSFTSEQLQCGRSNCQKAFSLRRVASTLVSQINGDYTRCQEGARMHTKYCKQ